jgi:hypothetical protein
MHGAAVEKMVLLGRGLDKLGLDGLLSELGMWACSSHFEAHGSHLRVEQDLVWHIEMAGCGSFPVDASSLSSSSLGG